MNGTTTTTHTLRAWSEDEAKRRDKVLAELKLPKSLTAGDRSVSAAACRAVLYRIAAHAGPDAYCYPSINTLTCETGQGRRTVLRAVEALERLDLIRRELKRSDDSKIVCNHYWINWDQIEARGRPAKHPDATLPTDPMTPSEVPPGHQRSATSTPCCESQRSATSTPAKCHQCTSEVPPGHPTCNVDGVNKTPAPPVNRAGSDGAGVLKIRWGRKVAPAELHDPPRLLPELHAAAVVAGACRDTEADRLAFAALFAYALRQRQSANRFGLFTALLTGRHRDRFTTSRDWRTRPTQFDEEQARRWLAAIDAEDPLAVRGEARSTQPDPEAAARHQAERDHADALRRFALAMQDGRWSAGRRQEAAQP